MRINVPNAKDVVSTLLEKGRYEAEITSAKVNEEYGFFNPCFVIIDGPMQGKDGNTSPAGRKLYQTINFDVSKAKSDKHGEYILRNMADFMAACGLDLEEDGFDTDDLIGKTIQFKLGVKEYNGEMSNEIKSWIPA